MKSQRRNGIFYKVSEYLPTKYLLQRIKQKLYSEKNLAVKAAKLILPIVGQTDTMYHLKGCNQYSTTSVFFLPKILKLNLILRKHQTSPN